MSQTIPESVQSQLQTLHDNFASISNDIGALERPVGDFHGLLGDLQKALQMPKTFSEELETIREVLSTVQTVASEMAWIPEIGEAAGSLSEVLEPIVSKTPPGVMMEIESVLNEVDRALDHVKSDVKAIKDPVDRVYKAIDSVNGMVAALVSGSEALIQRYGKNPPQDVETCAGKINAGMAKIAGDIDGAKDAVLSQVQKYHSALDNIQSEFDKFDAYMTMIDSVKTQLEGKVFENAMREVRAIKNAADKVKRLGDWMVKQAINGLKKVGIDVASAVKFFHGLEAQFQQFVRQHIENVVDGMKAKIEKEVDSIPAVKELVNQVTKLENSVITLEQRVDAFFASECVKIFGEK